MTADGSYTAPAHSPMIATVSSVAATIVRRRYCAEKIERSALACFAAPASARCHLSVSFTRRSTMIDTTTGTTPTRNIARQPKVAPIV
jgi:hypothetical protein